MRIHYKVKKMERIRLPILLVLCTYMVTLFSCAKEKTIVVVKPPLPQNTMDATFAVTLPGLSQNISTYAITENEENKLSTVDVLVFKVVGTSETFAYKARGRNIKPITANSSQFQVSLMTHATDNFRFVVIANARAVVDATGMAAGDSKAVILNRLIINKPGVWNTNSVTDYNPLPMWGESAAMLVTSNLTTLVPLPLLRSQLKVDVEVSEAAQPTFRMTSISVYNTGSNARIAPIAANYNAGKVTAVSLPSPVETNAGPLVYPVQNPAKSEGEIYLFERARVMISGTPAPPGAAGAASLIIGGHYNGSPTETYYKVEFLSNDAIPVPLSLLRNHKYVFNILKVGGAGYDTKEKAMASKPSNMQVTTTTVDLNDMPIVYFDEHYYLAMQTDLVVYPTNESRSEYYKIYTNYPGGFTYTSDSSWLTFNPYSEGGNVIASINAGGPRVGTITITAGKIRANIKVYQGWGSQPLPLP